jgi:hypothetical protein
MYYASNMVSWGSVHFAHSRRPTLMEDFDMPSQNDKEEKR